MYKTDSQTTVTCANKSNSHNDESQDAGTTAVVFLPQRGDSWVCNDQIQADEINGQPLIQIKLQEIKIKIILFSSGQFCGQEL